MAAISDFPTPTPSRSQAQDVFDPAVEAFIDHLPTFVSEANTVAAAMNMNSTNDTSASSVAIGTGAKTFTVSAGKSFLGGMYLMIADTAAPSTNFMVGQVTSYSGTTLVMNIKAVGGSGTKTAWTISQTVAYETIQTFNEVITNGTGGALDIGNANSTEEYQIRVAGTMTFNASALNGISLSATMSGGAATTTLRGAILTPVFAPSASGTAQMGAFIGPTVGNANSPTSLFGVWSRVALNASASGGAVVSAYGYYADASFSASATADITTWLSYHAADVPDGTGTTVSTAAAFSSAMNTAAGTRWGFLHSGTANNAFNANTRFGGVTAPTVAVDVTGALAVTTTIKTGGYTVATLPAGTVGTRAYVTDATAPTWLAALTGGGAVVCPVFKNATIWVSA